MKRAAGHRHAASRDALAPRMANDANIDLDPLLTGVTNRNFRARRPRIVDALIYKLKGKLAVVGQIISGVKAPGLIAREAVAQGTGR